ncbi:MAG: cation-translocating P-type ATPase [Verrucomicrobia bacterium]|nr:cation-translocating P-type ATPase [Verrucomicrobiota bacterium]
MLAVAIGASLIGAYAEGALLLFLFSTAGALEHFALHRTKREIDALFKIAPKTATAIDPQSGIESEVPVEKVTKGMWLRVRPGDTFAVDAEVMTGESTADESSLTGEAHPVPKAAGDKVYSGTRNIWGSLDLKCLRPASESSLQKIIRLIQDARHSRAPSQRLTDRFGPGYTWGVLGATALMFLVWWQLFDLSQQDAFYRAMTLLVVASPCALVLSIPSAILAAIAWGAKHGILFRGGAAIEQLAGIKVVAFDKTGTLTSGDLRVESIESFPPGQEHAVGQLAYNLELKASHPIARAIVSYGENKGYKLLPVDGFRNLTGQGVKAEINGKKLLLGRRDLLETGPLKQWADQLQEPADGLSEVWLVTPDCVGRILLADRVRPESRQVVSALRNKGVHTVMLTGDRAGAAALVAKAIEIDEVKSGLSPEGKVDAVAQLRQSDRLVAMLGDGINDAPCLAAADIGVAMGARGSDAALEQSDVVLMNDRIERFLDAYQLSCRAKAIIRQNIAISLGTVVIMVLAAIAGIIPIAVGVLAHEGSTVIVCLNSMRLLRTPS